MVNQLVVVEDRVHNIDENLWSAEARTELLRLAHAEVSRQHEVQRHHVTLADVFVELVRICQHILRDKFRDQCSQVILQNSSHVVQVQAADHLADRAGLEQIA